jgi:hypothetical protein
MEAVLAANAAAQRVIDEHARGLLVPQPRRRAGSVPRALPAVPAPAPEPELIIVDSDDNDEELSAELERAIALSLEPPAAPRAALAVHPPVAPRAQPELRARSPPPAQVSSVRRAGSPSGARSRSPSRDRIGWGGIEPPQLPPAAAPRALPREGGRSASVPVGREVAAVLRARLAAAKAAAAPPKQREAAAAAASPARAAWAFGGVAPLLAAVVLLAISAFAVWSRSGGALLPLLGAPSGALQLGAGQLALDAPGQ